MITRQGTRTYGDHNAQQQLLHTSSGNIIYHQDNNNKSSYRNTGSDTPRRQTTTTHVEGTASRYSNRGLPHLRCTASTSPIRYIDVDRRYVAASLSHRLAAARAPSSSAASRIHTSSVRSGRHCLAPHRLRIEAACVRASGATAPAASPAGRRADSPFVLGRIPSSVRKPYLNGLVAALQGLCTDSVYVRASGAIARLDGRQMPISIRRLTLPTTHFRLLQSTPSRQELQLGPRHVFCSGK